MAKKAAPSPRRTGITLSLKQIGLVAGTIVALGGAWAVAGKLYGHFGKAADITRLEAMTLAEVQRVEVRGETTAVEVRLMQIAASLDRYRVVCGADFKKCPTERDAIRVEELLKEQKKLDEEQRKLLEEHRAILRQQQHQKAK